MSYRQGRQKQSFIIPNGQNHAASHGIIVRICLLIGSLLVVFGLLNHVQAQTLVDGTQVTGSTTSANADTFSEEVLAPSSLRIVSTSSGYTATFNGAVAVGGSPGTLSVEAGSGGAAEAIFASSETRHFSSSTLITLSQTSTHRARLTFVTAAPSSPFYQRVQGQAITAQSAGDGVITVRGSNVNNITLFTLPIGVGTSSSNAIGELNIGDGTDLGHAYMYEKVNAQTINVRAGSAAGQHSTALFHATSDRSDVVTNSLNVTASSTAFAQAVFTTEHVDAKRSEDNSMNLGTVTLNSNGSNHAILFFVGVHTRSHTVDATIDGASSGEGSIIVMNVGGTVFRGLVGGTKGLRGFNVVAGPSGSVTTTLNGAGQNQLGAVVLDDNSSSNRAMLTFSGAAAQTIGGTIDGAAAGEGVVNVTNPAGVTFSDAIGGTNAIGGFNVAASSSSTAVTVRLNGVGAHNLGTVMLQDVAGSQAQLVIGGNSAQTINSAINSFANGEGGVLVSNTGGLVTFANAIGTSSRRLRLLTTNANTTTIFSTAVYADAVSLGGRVTFGETGNEATTVTIANDTRIILDSTLGAGATMLTASGAITAPTATANAVSIEIPSNFTSGTITVLDGGAGTALNLDGFTIANTNPTVEYQLILADNNRDLQIIASPL